MAIIHYEITIEIEPDFPNSHYNLGLVYISLGKYKEAIPCIDKYVALSPESEHNGANKLLRTLTSMIR